MLNSTDKAAVRPVWLAVALAAGLAGGYMMDKNVAPTPVPAVAGDHAPAGQSASTPRWPGFLASTFARNADSAGAAPAEMRPLASASEVLASLEQLPADADAAEVERLGALLSESMQTDEGLRRRVLAAYLSAPNEQASMGLALALHAVRGPDLAQAALEASGPERPAPERLAAVQLLAHSNIELPAARPRLRASLTNGTVNDPALVAATLSALRPRGLVGVAEQSDMQAMVQPYLRAADADVRQQALDALTAWAPREPATLDILRAAVRDPSPAVRAGAVSAYARSAASAAEARDVLRDRMADEQEAIGVRQAAALALTDVPLDPATLSAYEKFKASSLGRR